MSNQILKLRLWEEFSGVLQNVDIKADEGLTIASFSQGNQLVMPFTLHLKEELGKRIGQRISLLHTDIIDKNYLVLKGD